jgi:polyisoprenoid-binding protein YceI
LKFRGRGYKTDGEEVILEGDLTIRHVSKPVKVEVEFGGMVMDPWEQTKDGFTISGKVSRK